MGLFHFAVDMLGLEVDPSLLAPSGAVDLPGYVRLATWGLEALGLAALFLLIHGRSWGWMSGLLTGWIAWVFRGPLLVVTVVGTSGLPPSPWWSLAFSWWILYSLCGLLLGGVAAALGIGSETGHETGQETLPPPEPVPFRQPQEVEPPRVETVEEPLPPPAGDRLEEG